MANTFFQFKQFTIHQEHCAMKVTTDACLFGAWAAEVMKNEELKLKNILDIGAGTGLLSLMLAQKSIVKIHAVEIDEAAAAQAKKNFESSSFKERLHVHHCSIQQFNAQNKFDFIISNPPFFDNDLKSNDDKRNLALHGSSLSLEALLQSIKTNLTEDGEFAILLPYHRAEYFIKLAKEFYLQEQVLVKQTEKHEAFRSMLLFSKQPVQLFEKEITIKQNNQYSIEFVTLLKDYYLHL